MGKYIQLLNIRQQFYVLLVLFLLSQASILVWDYLQFGALHTQILVIDLVSALVLFAVCRYFGDFNGKRAETIVTAMNAMAQGDLSKKINLTGKDEYAWMCWEYTCARKGFKQLVETVVTSATQLASAAEELSTITVQSSQGVATQQGEIQKIASAMEDMSTTVRQVAYHAANAAKQAQETDEQSKQGQEVVNQTITTIHVLADEVKHASTVIEKLKQDSISIGAVLDVIRDIAEQTNLLALNAAIEAARAGEQGRGFAVVADEVRTLASRTQQSTQEIHEMIERLQSGANEAVAVMEHSREKAEISEQEAAKADKSLETITRVVDEIKKMNVQIASVAEQQNTTAEEINGNIMKISEVADETATASQQTASSSDDLAQLAVALQEQLAKFKTSSV